MTVTPTRIHHVGVAVTDMDESIRIYTTKLGAELLMRKLSAEDGLEAALIKTGDGEVELLRPLNDESPVGKFLARRGPGLHHVAYAVPDIDRALAAARSAGLEVIDAEPRIGLHGMRIAFLHPKTMGGVLTELVEA